MVDPTLVHRALERVRDPELDQDVLELGFVADVRILDGRVEVDLKLPTYFCAPNFAWVMVADAHAQVGEVEGVEEVTVTLLDHMTAAEITAGVADGHTFDQTFPGLSDGSDLASLRTQFQRKAFVVRQEQVARELRRRGHSPTVLGRGRYGQLPTVTGADRLHELRRALGFDVDPDSPLLLHDDGSPVGPDEVERFLQRSRLTRVSVEGNRDFCEGVLATRTDHDALLGPTGARGFAPPTTPFVPTGASS